MQWRYKGDTLIEMSKIKEIRENFKILRDLLVEDGYIDYLPKYVHKPCGSTEVIEDSNGMENSQDPQLTQTWLECEECSQNEIEYSEDSFENVQDTVLAELEILKQLLK